MAPTSDAAPLAADVVARVLIEEQVHFFFGIPGIQNLALYSGLERAGARAVLISNEESAAFAAAGVFEATDGTEMACVNIIGKIRPRSPLLRTTRSRCLFVSAGGPGVTHALAGIAVAKDQEIPMLVLTAGIKTGPAHRQHKFQLHDVDNLGMLRSCTKLAIAPVSLEDLADVFRRAVRVAATPPFGPVAVELPVRPPLAVPVPAAVSSRPRIRTVRAVLTVPRLPLHDRRVT